MEFFPHFAGRLGFVDYDEVELSNLHRQILHTETRVGVPKSSSAAHSCTKWVSSYHVWITLNFTIVYFIIEIIDIQNCPILCVYFDCMCFAGSTPV